MYAKADLRPVPFAPADYQPRNNALREQASLATGRERAFALTEQGESYMGPFLASMNAMEARAVLRMGSEKLAELTDLMEQYSQALRKAMEETRETGNGHGETLRF